MKTFHVPNIPVDAVEEAFTAFYDYLTNSGHFSAYFHSKAQIDHLIHKQKESFLYSLALDDEAFALHYRELGHMHAEIGVTIEDLIAGLKIIRDKMLEMQVLPADQLYDFIERVETFLAHGYLDHELNEMLQHADVVLKNAPQSMPEELSYVVNWFVRLASVWKDQPDLQVEVEPVEQCSFSEIIDRYVADKKERVLLHHEHKMQHVMAQSCHHFLQEKDYMLANFLLVRLFSITVALFNRLLSAASMKQLEQAKRDPLTGLHMRHDLPQFLFQVREKSRQHRQGMGVLMLDLDHFKRINDTYGHDMGDAVLKHIAALLQHLVRDDDVVTRYGGEEILIFLPSVERAILDKISERIRREIERSPVQYKGHVLPVTSSIGCLYVPYEALNAKDEMLLKQADQNLYNAKHLGRNQVVCSSLDAGLTNGN